jgi:DNA repair exonuclease SbcCD nuclease subunit
VQIIGDPHIGREFKANVPLERRGEREEMMLKEFDKHMTTPEKLVICIGDLFDSPKIGYSYILDTIEIVQRHAQKNKDKKYIFIAGNHDISPVTGAVGAFELLEVSVGLLPNVFILRRPTTLCGVVFFPWEWGRSALEQLDDIELWTDTAVGHWDLVDYGGSTDHLCPAAELQAKGVKNIISGHWHVAGDYDIDGVNVLCTGSMQPMTHAEDPDGKMYVTMTEKEYAKCSPDSLRNKYVRIIAQRGREITPPPTCLGFKVQTTEKEQEEVERVSLGDFDIHKILDKHLKAKDVPKPIQKEIKDHLSDIA